MHVYIRQATREDLKSICDLISSADFPRAAEVKAFYKNPYELLKRVAASVEVFFVAVAEDVRRLLGAISIAWRKEEGVAAIPIVIVQEDARRQGIGGKLLDHLLEEAKKLGIRKIYANVAADNIPSSLLFVKKRFIPEGLLSDIYEDGSQVIVYGRKLMCSDKV